MSHSLDRKPINQKLKKPKLFHIEIFEDILMTSLKSLYTS